MKPSTFKTICCISQTIFFIGAIITLLTGNWLYAGIPFLAHMGFIMILLIAGVEEIGEERKIKENSSDE